MHSLLMTASSEYVRQGTAKALKQTHYPPNEAFPKELGIFLPKSLQHGAFRQARSHTCKHTSEVLQLQESTTCRKNKFETSQNHAFLGRLLVQTPGQSLQITVIINYNI